MNQPVCTHKEYVPGPVIQDEDTGEWIDTSHERSMWVDTIPGDGRFHCQRCGEVGYYTGRWRAIYEGKTEPTAFERRYMTTDFTKGTSL